MNKQKKNLPSFLAGMATMALSLTLVGTALAVSGRVEYNRAGVALCGQQQVTAGETWTAPNGQKVPTMITYVDEAGGKTNYLSLRQISEMLRLPVRWNAAENRVELGDERARIEFVQESYLQAVKRTLSGEEPVKIPDRDLPAPGDKVLRGDPKLIKARGGTMLPDDEPGSYARTMGQDGTLVFHKLFISKTTEGLSGVLMREYEVGNLEVLPTPQRELAEQLPGGVFPVNKKGESYGSDMLSQYVGYQPDLIAAAGEDGKKGYIRRDDVALPDFQSPQEALEWQNQRPSSYDVPLYDCEGTQIGTFHVGGSAD